MKRLPVIYALIISMVLTGCQGTAAMSEAPAATPAATPTPTPAPTPTPTPGRTLEPNPELDALWDELESKYPTVTYDQIQAGNYADQYVCIEAVVNNIRSRYGLLFFDAYYPVGSTYEFDNGSFDVDNPVCAQAKEMQNGDVIKFCSWVTYANFLFPANTLGMKITELTPVPAEDFMAAYTSAYKDSCGSMDYQAVIHNLNDYRYNKYKVTGRVSRIIREIEDFLVFLLETDEGDIIAVRYYLEQEHRVGPILEDDTITVYGYLWNLTDGPADASFYGIDQPLPRIFTRIVEL